MTMQKTYDPKTIEPTIYAEWEASDAFKPTGNGSAYCIMLPPPNVTGTLHLGHAFQTAIMDALIRYHRMQGHQTLWQAGVDHAGIATQMVVERQLLQANKTRYDLGREAFVEKVWEWKKQSGDTILKQLRRLGASADWSRSRFTMDEGLSHAVQKVFIQLYEEDLIYRGKRLVNWDPVLHTAVSDLEVVNEEETGKLWHIRYPLTDGSHEVIIATTRPETLLGDAAVAVHPDDPRYQNLVGQTLKLPLTDRTIPIIADHYVDPEFGTGCVKITPAHDFNDYEVGQRHQLPLINILTADAKLNENVPPAYQGLDRFAARKQIVQDLQQQGLLEKIEDHIHKIPRGDRSKAVIEPWLTDQWFVKTKPLAKPAIDAVQNGAIEFIPKTWAKTYFQWMNNIQDWCISRQLWWGHRIPAWYDLDGNIYVGTDETAVREKYQLSADLPLTQDEDVLDTWFSSALWPFSTLGWPEHTPAYATFYPTQVLVTGFDIIFFWVARMIMMGIKFTEQIPFHKVYMTGLIRDPDGQKMSKSKGNILDPLDLIDGITLEALIEKRTASLMQPQMKNKIIQATKRDFPNGMAAYGTDALRFTLCSLASTGRDIRFDLGRLEGHRNFCNKLWNATRYVLMNVSKETLPTSADSLTLSVADQWILSILQRTIQQTHEHFQLYRFDLLTQTLHDFIWHEYCDWYLELSKPILTGENIAPEIKRGTEHTLIVILENILKLLHPVMPFITEQLWHQLPTTQGSIMLTPYPAFDDTQLQPAAESDIAWLKQMIMQVRNMRGEMNISPGKRLPILLSKGDDKDQQCVEKYKDFLMRLAKFSTIDWLDASQTPPPAATALVGRLELRIPLEGLVNKAEEIQRLNKAIEKSNKDLQQIQSKLSNANFIQKAPPEIVEKERAKEKELAFTLEKLTGMLQALSS